MSCTSHGQGLRTRAADTPLTAPLISGFLRTAAQAARGRRFPITCDARPKYRESPLDLRTLRYFLAVAREENMTRAAERLHVTQPTLSKALKSLEDELGKKLFVRHAFNISLTDEGLLLRDRARELVGLADRMEQEFRALDDVSGGELAFGMTETAQTVRLAQELRTFKDSCPDLHFQFLGGGTRELLEKLDRGLVDFAVLDEEPDPRAYESLAFPEPDVWGLLLREDDPAAAKAAVTLDDLAEQPLFCPEALRERVLPRWSGERFADLTHAGTPGPGCNAATLVREGFGRLITFANPDAATPGSGLAFRPFEPPLVTPVYLARVRNRTATPVAERFFAQVSASFSADSER